MTEEISTDEALALARAARERVAARAAAAPAWYAPLYGLCCGVLVGGGGLLASDGVLRTVGSLLVAMSLLGVAFLYRHWQQVTGLSVNGYRAGTTRWIAVGLAVALVALMLAGMVLVGRGLVWAPVACGVAAALIAAFGSAAWDRAWQRELASGSRAP